MATQPSKPSPEVLAKLKQLREQFAAKAEMERRRRQAQDNWEQSDTYKRQYPQGEADGGRVPSLDEMRLAITKAKGGLAKFLENSKVKDVLYRGGIGHKELNKDFLEGKSRSGYATFASTSPHVASSYANTHDDSDETVGGVAPLHINVHTVHEFPTTVDRHGSRKFDKIAFDKLAQKLEPGHALVARQVYDQGPRASKKTDPKMLYSYPSDIYAWNNGTETKSALSKAKGGSVRPVETTVKLGDRELPITMDVYDKRAGNKIVHVNPDTFDKAFQKSSWQYVGPKGEGGIKDRYSRFVDYAKSAKSVNASNAGVNKEGVITFGDGRHRYAYMRDQGLDKIPMSMDKQSIEHARRHGYLHEAKGGSVEPKIMSAAERESNLQKFLEPSVVKDRMYHGTSHYASTPEKTDKLTSTGIKRFRKKPKGTFLSPDANLADYTNTKGGTEGAVYPVYAQVKNPFDYENSEHINALASQTKIDPEGVRHLLFRDDENWQVLEEPYMQRAIKQLGHDGYYTLENGRKNLAVFDPKKIKSATGNRGTYDVNEKDITKARGGRVTHAHHLEIEERPL